MKKSIILALIASFVVCHNVMAQAWRYSGTKSPISKQQKVVVAPKNIVSLQFVDIQETFTFESAGIKYYMILAKFKHHDPNVVDRVYVCPTDFDGYITVGKKKVEQIPSSVVNLIYHNLGDDSKSFCGITVQTRVYKDKAHDKYTDYFEELRVPDDIGQKIMDLISDYTKWKNATNIGYIKTDNPKLCEPKEKVDFKL